MRKKGRGGGNRRKKNFFDPFLSPCLSFTSVGTTRGQGIIRVVVVLPVVVFVATFLTDIYIFWKILKVNKAQIQAFSA